MREDKSDFFYKELTPEQNLENLKDFNSLMENFNTFFKGPIITPASFYRPLVVEIYRRIDQRADYYLYFHSKAGKEPMEMSQTKEIALFAFWILKLKPLFQPMVDVENLFREKNCTVNEYFAAYVILSLLEEASLRKDLGKYFSPNAIDNMVYNFMYRDISKEAMICYVDSLLGKVEE